MKQLILEFLAIYGIAVKYDETSAFVELMMDDHICVRFEEVEYYVPENHSDYTTDDYLILEFLDTCRHV